MTSLRLMLGTTRYTIREALLGLTARSGTEALTLFFVLTRPLSPSSGAQDGEGSFQYFICFNPVLLFNPDSLSLLM